MSTATAEPRTESWLTRNIYVHSVRVDGKNVADRTTGPEFDEFCEDVKQHGVLQAILVRASESRTSANVMWHLIAGHRRLAAAKRAGQEEIPAVVSTLGPEHDDELRLVENLHRRDLHPLDEALGFERLLVKGVKDAAGIAQRVGRSTRYVYDRLRLINLNGNCVDLFRAGRIELGHAIILARLSPADQERAISTDGRALFTAEAPLFVPERDTEFPGDGVDEDADPWFGFKARTANELQAWVDDNVRMEPSAVDPMLFPVTAEEVAASQKVLPITRAYHLQDGAKSKERTFGPKSWKRADGQRGSKTCELSVTGMVVAGDGRGEAFAVCAAKEKCTVHWGAEIKEKAKRAKARAKEEAAPKSASEPKQPKFDHELMDFERKAEDEALGLVTRQSIATAQVASEDQFLRALVFGRTWLVSDYIAFTGSDPNYTNRDAAAKWIETATVADLRACLLHEAMNDDAEDVCEALGIDQAAIVKEHVAKAVAEFKAKRAAAAKAPKPPKGERARKRGAK